MGGCMQGFLYRLDELTYTEPDDSSSEREPEVPPVGWVQQAAGSAGVTALREQSVEKDWQKIPAPACICLLAFLGILLIQEMDKPHRNLCPVFAAAFSGSHRSFSFILSL